MDCDDTYLRIVPALNVATDAPANSLNPQPLDTYWTLHPGLGFRA